jgi:large subunit ribosomal protein L24
MKVKKGDTVIVTAGKDKGKQGSVVKAIPTADRVVIEGVNIKTKHKKKANGAPGELVKYEFPIHVSNVAHLDPKDGKPTRVGYQTVNGKKIRVSKRSGLELK